MSNIVVVGGGAAGLLAGIAAAEQGAQVTILEKMFTPGRKILITGKGRCNITNDCEIPEIIKNLPGNGRFLNSALHRFSNIDIVNMLESHGLKTKVERGGRVFPVTDKAKDVVDTLLNIYREKGGKILIKDGPFKGLSGIFEKELEGKERVMILLDSVKFSVSMEIDRDLIAGA